MRFSTPSDVSDSTTKFLGESFLLAEICCMKLIDEAFAAVKTEIIDLAGLGLCSVSLPKVARFVAIVRALF